MKALEGKDMAETHIRLPSEKDRKPEHGRKYAFFPPLKVETYLVKSGSPYQREVRTFTQAECFAVVRGEGIFRGIPEGASQEYFFWTWISPAAEVMATPISIN